MVYFPEEVWSKINCFLGEDYWIHRRHLTLCSQALDFLYSNYRNNSYWTWYVWRSKYDLNWNRFKPRLPERFNNILNNPFVKCIDPPKLSVNGNTIVKKHMYYRDKVFK